MILVRTNHSCLGVGCHSLLRNQSIAEYFLFGFGVKAVTTQCLAQDEESGLHMVCAGQRRGQAQRYCFRREQAARVTLHRLVWNGREGLAGRSAGPRWAGVSCSWGRENRRE
jgi:hypothetical protein